MSLRIVDEVIVNSSNDRDVPLSAEEIYSRAFERTDADAAELRALGLDFSSDPASPVIVLAASSVSGEPLVRSALAGRVGNSVTQVKQTPSGPVDYIVSKGTWHPLPQRVADEYQELLAACGISNPGGFTIGRYLQLLKLSSNFKIEDSASAQLAAGTLAPQLPQTAVSGLKAEPYPYQSVGLKWLGFMARNGVGSILGDEMGLGKTLQVIGVLLSEVQHGRGPNLVVCPATLLENWGRELRRFAPTLAFLTHAGSRRTGHVSELQAKDVVVTSYETLVGDISMFRGVQWNLVAVDEAQNIKNPNARRSQRLKEVPRRCAIAVTGTPVENRLRDLWSICDFVLPGYLGVLTQFEKRFPDTEDSAKELEPIVSAIMLRRRVRDVATDLPPRIDVPVPMTLDERSAIAYEAVRKEAAERNPHAADLTALVHLRMFCAHPWSVRQMTDFARPVDCSPKMQRCLEIIEEIVAGNEKALIFTSFNEIADLLSAEIARQFEIPVWLINGSVPVPERQMGVDAFSKVSGGAVMILNPKAGGVGLNITAASHVIHYNLEWNPATEDQASARSHRRGQTRPVTVHRLFYVDTVEEVIAERVARKRALADNAVIGTDGDEPADILAALKRSPISAPQHGVR